MWKEEDDKLKRTFVFKDFKSALTGFWLYNKESVAFFVKWLILVINPREINLDRKSS